MVPDQAARATTRPKTLLAAKTLLAPKTLLASKTLLAATTSRPVLGRDEAAELDGGPSAPGSRTWEADR